MLGHRIPVALCATLAILFCNSLAFAQAVREIPLPAGRGYSGIAVTGDGTVYMSETDANAIAVLKPDKSLIESRTITPSSAPRGLTIGPDGNLWFVEPGASNIGVMQPDGTMLTEFSTRCRPSVEIARGSGNALWFGENCADKTTYVTRINATGTMTRFLVGSIDHPMQRGISGVIEGPDKNIWFIEQDGHAVGRLNLSTGRSAEFSLPSRMADTFALFLGPDGNLWFPEVLFSTLKLARVEMDGTITEFDWPGATELVALGIGKDGNFWGVDGSASIWRIDIATSGIVPTKIFSKSSEIYGGMMFKDGRGNLWFSEYRGCAVGVLDFDAVFGDPFDVGCS